MRKLCVALMIAALSVLAHGQTQPITGNITTSTAGPGNCVSIRAQNNSAVGIIVSGTWSGTLTPNIQISTASGAPTIAKKVVPVDNSTAQATITANGGYLANVGGFTQFNLCATAFSSGTAVVSLYSTPAPNNSTIAGGGAGGGVTAFTGDGTLINNSGSTGSVTVSIANAGADTVWGNPTGSSGAPGYTNAPVVASLTANGASGVSATAGPVSSGANGGAAGVYNWVGSTSGTANCTAPAVAGTAQNPIVCSNNWSVPGIVFVNGSLPAGTPGIAASSSANINEYDFGGQSAIFYNSNLVEILGTHRFHPVGSNLLFVTSNFTTAANTNLQAITGLSFSHPSSNALNWNFHCSLAYTQATGTAAVAFGIQAVTNAPTNIFATGKEYTAAGTVTTGVLPTLTTTTATNIVSGTPGATGTNLPVEIDGTLELPASTNTINIMVSTATSGDAVTVLRGSYCMVF